MADAVLKLSPAKEPVRTAYKNVVVRSVQITDAVLKLSPAKEPLSPFLIGRMFVREPSWKYLANLVGC